MLTALLVCVGLLVSAGPANANVVPRLAELESPTSSPYDFDQVSKRCSSTVATRDKTLAYSGSASLKVQANKDASCATTFARGIFQANSTRHLVEGDDFWFGAAIYLPAGFYSTHAAYSDLLRLDSYVRDNSSSTPFLERAEINFASWSNDSLYVRAARGGTQRTLIGPISPKELPEGTWNWVEIHVDLSTDDGAAYTELKINGESLGSSRAANLFAGAAPFNRLRYGLVSMGWTAGSLTAYVDRASLSPTERGPIARTEPEPEPEPPAPPSEPEPSPSLVSLWRLNETSGTTAADTMGAAPGAYVNEPTLGAEGIVGDALFPAVSFDGIDDHVVVPATAPLNVKDGLTIEAWVQANAYRGSMVQRTNSYELRPQGSGNIVFRVWVDGIMESLASGPETISTGDVHHLVGTYDGTSMKIYADGQLVASQPQTGQITHSVDPLYIGRNSRMDTYFRGVIDEAALYSAGLSADTVFEHYEDGKSD
jgi:hypothetical protein